MKRIMIWAAGILLALAVPAFSQQARSQCADCHIAQADPPNARHLADWERSAHGRADVGCEKCHGGDPTTFESFRAHQGILTSRNPASPVAYKNLPATCGKCHAGPYVAFQSSRHFALIQTNSENPPVCVTCHGEVAANRPSAKTLERTCARCHAEGKLVPRPNFPTTARRVHEEIDAVQTSLRAARQLIDHLPKGQRRTQMEDSYQQAQVPVTQAIHDTHAFVFDSSLERIGVAKQRTDALMKALAGDGQ